MSGALDKLDKLTFRLATVADIDGLLALFEAFLEESDYPNLGIEFSERNARDYGERVIGGGLMPYVLAIEKETGEIVGTLSYGIDGSCSKPFAYLDKFYVVENWRNSAAGPVLLKTALDLAKGDGAIAFRAGLSSGIPGAAALFARMGFETTPYSVLMARKL